MFVAAIVHISSEVADAYDDGHWVFIATVFPQFGLLILAWLEQVLYASRFRMTQTGDGLLRFLSMALVLLMGLSIGNTNNETSHKLVLVAYSATKCVMCVQLSKTFLIRRARNHSAYMIVENVVTIVTCIAIEVLVNVEPVHSSAAAADEHHRRRLVGLDERQWTWTAIYSALFLYSGFSMVVAVYLRCIRDLGVNIPINVPVGSTGHKFGLSNIVL